VKEENIDFWVSAEFKLREVEAWELLSPHPGIAHFFMAWREKVSKINKINN
jgi:hypothetical protein